MTDNFKKNIKVSGTTLFFALIILYALWGSHNLISGAKIKNVDIKSGPELTEISGNAKGAVELTLNGREISLDQDGNFRENVVLLLGYNVINISAVDKFGNTDAKNYQLLR